MLVEFLVGEGCETSWVDLYIDRKGIQGFYLPEDYDNGVDKAVNVMYYGSIYGFKQSPKLLDYLAERFVNDVKV